MPSNLYLLENAAGKLGKLLDEVVFVGGSTLDLIVTDEAAAPIRGTVDVDVIAESQPIRIMLSSQSTYGSLDFPRIRARLRLSAAGFMAI